MEFIKANYLDTSTQLVVNSNTSSAENIIDRDQAVQYFSQGFNNDTTTTTIRINFDETLSVSRIAILGCNWKSFTVFYNGATANTFSLTSTGATTSSNFTTNSETSLFLRATAVNCTSVSFDVKSTQVSNSEKAVGHIILSDTHIVFPIIPSAKNYTPDVVPKQIVHTLSDGGTRTHTVKDKLATKIKLQYISQSFRDDLKTLFDLHTNFIFAPFGTTTGWDEYIFDCVWPGKFEFFKYSDDAATAGFTGSIELKETPG